MEIASDILAKGWVRHGDDVVVVTRTPQPDPSADTVLPYTVVRDPGAAELISLVRGADVVFHNNPCMRWQWAVALTHRPWLTTLRAWLVEPGTTVPVPRRPFVAAKVSFIRTADMVLANSMATREHIGGVDEVVPNSYRERIFRPGPETAEPGSVVCASRGAGPPAGRQPAGSTSSASWSRTSSPRSCAGTTSPSSPHVAQRPSAPWRSRRPPVAA